MGKKILVAYYSLIGNTRRIADELHSAIKADVETIRTERKYLGIYTTIVEQGHREVEKLHCPKIQPLTFNPLDYNVIIVGTPTWWYTIAPAVRTYLSAYDWTGKTIIPFQTYAEFKGHALKDIRSLCKGAKCVLGKSIQFDQQGGAELVTKESEIKRWIKKVKAFVEE